MCVAWVRSGFTIASQESEPWAQRLLAKLRAAWVAARDVPEPSEHPAPRDYQVPQHQTRPIDTPRELARERDARASAGRTEADRASFRGHGVRPGDPLPGDEQRCAEHVAEIRARYDAREAVMLAAVRMRDAVVDWGSLVHAHVIADGECVCALSDVDGARVLLWDPDADAEPWSAIEREQAAEGTPAELEAASRPAKPRPNARPPRKAASRIGQ